MANKRQIFGQQSEALAVKHLQKKGYKIIAQNYRTKLGEIDIIAKQKETLVFVEVKARRSTRFGSPKAAVTHQKQRKISMVALAYLKTTQQTQAAARFDVVSIDYAADRPVVEVIKNAFELAYGWPAR
jgi:putative endonuclease